MGVVWRVVQYVAKYFNNHLGNFLLELRGEVVFKCYDDRIGRCNKGVFLDGSQAFDERNWGCQCPAVHDVDVVNG